MTLAAGTRLGSYEVTAALGAGGMGEVWRATDTKLGREVAIKVLPAAFAQDAERVARFRREIRGVVSGCGGGNYCPTGQVTREQMGVFIAATFGLTAYGP